MQGLLIFSFLYFHLTHDSTIEESIVSDFLTAVTINSHSAKTWVTMKLSSLHTFIQKCELCIDD